MSTTGLIELVVSGAQQPSDVVITFPDGTSLNITNIVVANPPEYSYTIQSANVEGIVSVLMDKGLADETMATIGVLTTGLSCCLNKVLNDKFDCTLMQQLLAVEKYVKNNKPENARVLYEKVLKLCVHCTTTAVPEQVAWNLFITNDTYTM